MSLNSYSLMKLHGQTNIPPLYVKLERFMCKNGNTLPADETWFLEQFSMYGCKYLCL